jgi:hypothetical protein
VGGRLLERRGELMSGLVETFGPAIERRAAVGSQLATAAASLTMTQTSVPLVGLSQGADGA